MMSYLWDNYFSKDKGKLIIITTIKENILFSDLTGKELKILESLLHQRTYQKEETIFSQSEYGIGMYMIVRGSVRILKETNQKLEPITTLTKGDFFGESSLVEEKSMRNATAIANEETLLLGFFKPDLLEIIDKNPSLGVKILLKLTHVLSTRLKMTTEKLAATHEN